MSERSHADRVRLFEQWTPKVHSIAHRFERSLSRWYDKEDLLSIGFERLWHATAYYEDDRGATFGTFAHYHVFYKYQGLVDYHRSLPRRGDIGSESIDATWPNGEVKRQFPSGDASARRSTAEADLDAAQDRDRALRALEGLPARYRMILRARVFEERQLAEIAREIGVSRERVRQLEGKALRKLRSALEGEGETPEAPAPGPISCCRAGAAPKRARKVALPPESP